MTNPSATGGPADRPSLRAFDLERRVEEVQARLAEVVALVEDLTTWAAQLPHRHTPVPLPTLVADFLPRDTPDPTVVERALQAFLTSIEQAADVATQTRGTVTTQLSPSLLHFPERGPASDAEAARMVRVSATLGTAYGNEERFEQQRQAARRLLTFDPATRTWAGQLPRVVSQAPDSWQSLLDIAETGAMVIVEP